MFCSWRCLLTSKVCPFPAFQTELSLCKYQCWKDERSRQSYTDMNWAKIMNTDRENTEYGPLDSWCLDLNCCMSFLPKKSGGKPGSLAHAPAKLVASPRIGLAISLWETKGSTYNHKRFLCSYYVCFFFLSENIEWQEKSDLYQYSNK